MKKSTKVYLLLAIVFLFIATSVCLCGVTFALPIFPYVFFALGAYVMFMLFTVLFVASVF